MPRRSPDRTRHWGTSARICAWPECSEIIAVSMLMHGEHWRMVPVQLRDALNKAQRLGDARAIERAAAAITEYARQQSGAQQGADAR